ncbi:flagellar basal body rod protein FlgC [Rhodobacteraceae bacterium]|nr:flagellar basal body rod protein FlgC [Paracoccaceae bacterium]
MDTFVKSIAIANSGMQAQSERLRRISENIANADTPGYHRKTVPMFSTDGGRVRAGATQLDQSDLQKIYDPSHPLADGGGYYQGSNVEILFEIADAREAQRSYEANVKLFEQAKKMSAELFDLLRK